MRASSLRIGVVFLFAAGCASFSSRELVHVVIFNDSSVAQPLQILVDGERVFGNLVVDAPAREPSIVATAYLRLPRGRHRIEVIRHGVIRGQPFTVRSRTRTDVQVHLKNGETLFDVTYGEKLYI